MDDAMAVQMEIQPLLSYRRSGEHERTERELNATRTSTLRVYSSALVRSSPNGSA